MEIEIIVGFALLFLALIGTGYGIRKWTERIDSRLKGIERSVNVHSLVLKSFINAFIRISRAKRVTVKEITRAFGEAIGTIHFRCNRFPFGEAAQSIFISRKGAQEEGAFRKGTQGTDHIP